MSHATPDSPTEDPFIITVQRPDGFPDERWERLKKQMADACAPAVLELLGRCSTHTWCVAAGTPEHDEYHVSRTADLLPPRAGDELAAVSAWITQPRGGGVPILVLDGHLPDQHMPLDIEVDIRIAERLLALVMDRPPALSDATPGPALRDLVYEVLAVGTATSEFQRKQRR